MTDEPRPDPDELIGLPEAARIAGLALETLQTQRRRGRLQAKRMGRDWFVTRAELHRYLHARYEAQGNPAPMPADYTPPRGVD